LPSKVLAKAIEYAHEKGVITICAAGNDSRKRVGYPAAYEHSVAVSATNYDRDLSFYSNWGKEIDVAAPGGDTRSDKNGDGQPDGVLQNTIEIQQPTESRYKWFQGTSMAAPHAAGVAALIVGAGVTNPDEVERIMKQTAAHPQSVERDDRFGAGIVDAAAAAASAQDNYVGERGLLAGLLALFGLSSLGLAAVRRRWVHVLGFTAMAGWAAGLFGTPAAYAVATTGWFGIGSPLVFSAALPVLATILLLGIKPTRGWLAGLSLGYAALLVHGAVVLPTLLSGLPGGDLVDRAWLAANAVVALLLARRITSLRR
jgi:serine protease